MYLALGPAGRAHVPRCDYCGRQDLRHLYQSNCKSAAAPRILSIEPPSAFAGASVVVEAAFDGNGTFYNETAYCRFGAAAVEAHVLDDTHVSCRVPPMVDARSDMPSVSIGIVGDAPGAIPATERDAPSHATTWLATCS